MKEIVTLAPAGGDELELSGDILVTSAAWGDHVVETQLAQGPMIRGAVPGQRSIGPVESEITLVVDAASPTFVETYHALERAVALLAERGGWVRRQRVLADGTLTLPVEAEVIAAELSEADGFLLERRIRLTRQPYWLGAEETVATLTADATSVKSISLAGLKGNLPGPGRIVIADQAGAARRWAEIGQSWSHPPQQIEFAAADVDPGAGELDGDVVEISPLVPSWRTIAELSDLPHRGTFQLRARAARDSDVAVSLRASYRAGGGLWRSLDPVELPSDGEMWDVGLGTIHHEHAEDGSLDLRVQARAAAVDPSGKCRFSRLTVMPAERYAVARGRVVSEAAADIAGFDDFKAQTSMTPLHDQSAPIGGTWQTFGDTDPAWTVIPGLGAVRAGSDNGATAGARLGTGTARDVTVEGVCAAELVGSGLRVATGVIARYVDAGNYMFASLWGAAVQLGGAQIGVCVVEDGTPRWLWTQSAIKARLASNYTGAGGRLRLTVTADGDWSLAVAPQSDDGEPQRIAGGSDPVLQVGGALEEGGVGILSRIQASQGTCVVREFAYYTSADSVQTVDVVRANGLGVLTDQAAYTAEADGSDPAPIADYRGARVWLPPGDSQLAIKLRRTELDSEPDSGPSDDDTGITVTHRPAWVTLPDEIEMLLPSDDLFPADDLYPAGP